MSIFLKKIGIIIISTFVIANLLSYISLWTLRQSSFYKPSFLVNAVSETNFDYIVLGASTGLTTLDTQVIDVLSGKNGINLSIDDTSISSQYLMLEHFLAVGKTTKVCVIAPSFTSFDTQIQSLSANDYRFLPFVNRSYVSEYYQSFSGTNANLLSYSRYFPMLGVSYYNTEVFYPSLLSMFQSDRRNRFDANGNYTYPVQNLTSELIENRETIMLSFKNSALRKIQALCDRENIKLICYISPIKNGVIVNSLTDYEIINHSDVLIKTDYFFDNVHVNSLGRQVISERFANDLSSYFKD